MALDELYASLRNSGLSRFEEADAIGLESDGTLSMLHGGAGEITTLYGMDKPD